jgi:hypothetical protein
VHVFIDRGAPPAHGAPGQGRICAEHRLSSPCLSRLLRRTVILTLARRKGQVTLQVHLIVQDSADFNNPVFDGAVKQEVTAAPTMPCDM